MSVLVQTVERDYIPQKEMSRFLVLEELSKQGAVEIGRLQSGDTVIGREPDSGGVAVNSKAVSRNHGIFSKIRNHWFYRDLGSTNGSWVDSVSAKEGQWKLIRPGTVLQLADIAIRITSAGDGWSNTQNVTGLSAIHGRSLIVFSNGDFVDEFLIPEYGRSLTIGGSQADLALDADVFEQPSLVIERRGDKVVALSLVTEIELQLNGEPVKGSFNLKDGDSVKVGKYTVILNDVLHSETGPIFEQKKSLKTWGAEGTPAGFNVPEPSGVDLRSHKRMPSGAFGRPPTELISETVSLDPEEIERRVTNAEALPSARYSTRRAGGMESFGSLEDKVIIGVGVVLFLILMLLVVWWVFI